MSSAYYPCVNCCAPIPPIKNCIKVYPKPLQAPLTPQSGSCCCRGIKIPLVRNKVVVYKSCTQAQIRPCGY